eukprot:6200298-Pleurochrysis_carterae.AAC.2
MATGPAVRCLRICDETEAVQAMRESFATRPQAVASPLVLASRTRCSRCSSRGRAQEGRIAPPPCACLAPPLHARLGFTPARIEYPAAWLAHFKSAQQGGTTNRNALCESTHRT